jgi:hypothetical protein
LTDWFAHAWQVRVRVSEMPVPHVDSVRQACARCRSPVWTERCLWESALSKVGVILCHPCAEQLLEGRPGEDRPAAS